MSDICKLLWIPYFLKNKSLQRNFDCNATIICIIVVRIQTKDIDSETYAILKSKQYTYLKKEDIWASVVN